MPSTYKSELNKALAYHTVILGIHDTYWDDNLNSCNNLIVKLTGTWWGCYYFKHPSQISHRILRPSTVTALSSTPNSTATI